MEGGRGVTGHQSSDYSYLGDDPAVVLGSRPGRVMESRGRAEIAFH